MTKLTSIFIKAISVGSHSGLSEGKKFALQVTLVDIYWSMLAFSFYTVHTYLNNLAPFYFVHGASFFVMLLSLWLVHKRYYDLARPIIHLCGLFVIFVSADAYGKGSGVEYYYFTSIMMPHLVYSLEEFWKGIWLSAVACMAIVLHHIYGYHLIFDPVILPSNERGTAITIVVMFTLTTLSIVRWRLFNAQREILHQQGHLIHTSNLVALGEMAAGLSHEINNPLQTLSLQSKTLKESMSELKAPVHVIDQLETVDSSIMRISKLVRSLRDLSRDVTNDPVGFFTVKEMLEEVMSLSSQRMKNHGIDFQIKGDTDIGIKGNLVRISQVLINLLNNSIDALEGVEEKWIKLELVETMEHVRFVLSDSGPGISPEHVHKLMQPFFTTKGPGKGTGLGLSISKNIIEKNGGTFYLDPDSVHTTFVIELPGMTELI